MHHNFATVRHRVMGFSAKCSERNCLHDKGQCLNTAIKYNSEIFKPVLRSIYLRPSMSAMDAY